MPEVRRLPFISFELRTLWESAGRDVLPCPSQSTTASPLKLPTVGAGSIGISCRSERSMYGLESLPLWRRSG